MTLPPPSNPHLSLGPNLPISDVRTLCHDVRLARASTVIDDVALLDPLTFRYFPPKRSGTAQINILQGSPCVFPYDSIWSCRLVKAPSLLA